MVKPHIDESVDDDGDGGRAPAEHNSGVDEAIEGLLPMVFRTLVVAGCQRRKSRRGRRGGGKIRKAQPTSAAA